MNIAQQIGGNTAVDLVLDLTADKDGAKYLLDATYEHGVKRVLETLMGHSSAEQAEVLEQDIEGAALMASVDKVRENTSGLRDAPTSQGYSGMSAISTLGAATMKGG